MLKNAPGLLPGVIFMKKKSIKPVKIKDPKKVAAGKARAAKSLRIGGRFTSNKFFEDVKEQAEEAGVKNVFKFFEQNENEFISLYSEWMQSAEYFDYTFLNLLKNYTGKIFVNDRENTNGTALQKLLKFNQYLKNNHDVVSWSIMPYIKLSGQLKFNLPTDEEMDDYDSEGLEDILENYGMKIIISEKKGKNQNKTKLVSRKGKFKKIEDAANKKAIFKTASKRKKR